MISGKPKKSGVGKGNWGNYKEDRKGNEEQTGAGAGEGEDGAEDKPQEEEKPAGITLSEYYQQHRQAQNEPQVNETKAKITSEQLTKELGTATALKTRSQQQVDDRKVGKKKDRLDVNHHAAINSEYANLLSKFEYFLYVNNFFKISEPVLLRKSTNKEVLMNFLVKKE